MGAWTQAITQGLGRVGSEAGSAVDMNLDLALKAIQNKLAQQSIQEGQQRIAQQQQKLKAETSPQFTTVSTP